MRDILSDDDKHVDLGDALISDRNNDEIYDDRDDDWEEDANPWIKPKLFLFIGGIIVVLLVLVFLLTGGGGGSEVTIDKIHNLEMRMAQLEGKISSFTDLNTRVSELENKTVHLASVSNPETIRTMHSIDKRIEKIESEIFKLSSSVKTPVSSETGNKQVASTSAAPQPQTQKTDKGVFHTVKSGETLYSIARDYGVSVASLQKLNKFSGNSIKVGQKIIIK